MKRLALAWLLAAAPFARAQQGSDGPPAAPPLATDGPPAPLPALAGPALSQPPAFAPAAGLAPAPAAAPSSPVPGGERTPPVVLFMTPAPGAYVSRTVAVSANATDNVGVVSVQFLLDGAPLGTPLAAPYTFQWGTLAASDGAHTLAAVATDAAGNSTTAVMTVNVDNSPPQLLSVSAASPASNAAIVRWTTSERSDARVDYGTTTVYGLAARANTAPLVEHAATLSGLLPGTEYHYRVTSRDLAGNQTSSPDAVFTTLTGAALAAASAASDDAAARAPQKLLSPARRDGVNDKAAFGPEAREVTIFDVLGRRVFHADSPGAGAPVVWDCRDGSGRLLESGVYLAAIVKRDGGKLSQSFSIVK